MSMKRCIIALGTLATLALASSAHAQTLTPPTVPPEIEVTAPNQVFLIGHAIGTQNYECQPVASVGRVGWVLFTPQATLFGELDEQLTTHFFSPNPPRAASCVPPGRTRRTRARCGHRRPARLWLILTPLRGCGCRRAGTQVGPTGGTTLAVTTFIQRVNTVGGLAPATGCDRPTDVGKKAFVPYTADYVFYRN